LDTNLATLPEGIAELYICTVSFFRATSRRSRVFLEDTDVGKRVGAEEEAYSSQDEE
jgi:hypothetical protein